MCRRRERAGAVSGAGAGRVTPGAELVPPELVTPGPELAAIPADMVAVAPELGRLLDACQLWAQAASRWSW